MDKVAVLITDLYEESEYEQPAKALLDEGFKLVHVGVREGQIVSGKKNKSQAEIDTTVDKVNADDFVGILIPGGFSPDILRAEEDIVEFTRESFNKGIPTFAICHGPQLLITAEVLKGRKLTGYKSIEIDIKNAGGNFIDQEVVVDGNLITSRTPKDLPAFIEKILETLKFIER